ncbi:nucleotidyltransferase [Asaia siamensis]
MSVLTYLQSRASNAVLSTAELTSINTSINTLSSRLNSYFGRTVAKQFRFGSSTRGTILPRIMDEHSDIDYMIVFSDGGCAPQTYIDRLRRFADAYYPSSDIKQSSPTIVLQLNHIRFDLVPALGETWSNAYKIPNGTSAWQITNPNDFNATLTAKNQVECSLIKPTIRLAKFWNAKAGYVFDSYFFEKWIVEQHYFLISNQKDYLFAVFDKLSATQGTQWRNERIERAKGIIANVRKYERENMPYSAEDEVKKLIPD